MAEFHPITLESQEYFCPSDAVSGDNIGKVHFLWSHQKFWNHYFGTTYTDSSYTYEIVGGADNAFSVDSLGEISLTTPANFASSTFITVRISVGGFYQDTVCNITRLSSSNCYYFDSQYDGSNGTSNGTRSRPYLKLNGSGLTPTAGKAYLWRRDRTYEREWVRLINPKVGGVLPDWITIDAWGQGERPTIDGRNNIEGSTNQRFLTLGATTLSNTNLDENLVANKVRASNFRTTHDKSNSWYPIEVKGMGDHIELRRLYMEETIFGEGFIYLSVYTNLPYHDRKIYMESIETLNNVERSIKIEAGGVTFLNGRHRNIGSNPTEHPAPGAANWPNVAVKYIDSEGENIATNNFGLQCRAGMHQYEWCYLKGYGHAMSVFVHTSQDGRGGDYDIKNSGYRNIIVEDCKTYASYFGRHGDTTGVADGIYFDRIKLINCYKGLEIAEGATNTIISYSDLSGTDTYGVRVYAAAGAGTKIHNITAFGNLTRDLYLQRGDVEVRNSNYGVVSGTIGTASNNSNSQLEAELIGAGTDLGYTHDLRGNPVPVLPSIGAIEYYVDPVETKFDLEVRENPQEWGTAVDLTNQSPYPEGTEVELQATPETWTQFYRWSRDGVTLSTNQNYLYTTRGQNDLVLGEFQPKQYPLVVTVTPIGGGSVNISSGNYTEGQQVPLIATPNSGYTFLNWQKNGVVLSTNPSYTHTKTAGNETISAHFTLAKHTLTVTAGTGGTAIGGGSFAQGETTSLVATVAGGYQFDGWYRDNIKLSGDNPYNYTARNQADTVQARFLRKSVAVISADPESGTKPLTVQFSSSGSVADSYAWDFGNGSTSFLALPYTVYQEAGKYTVTLTTTYGTLTDTATMEITVTDPVYVPPTVTITSPQNLSANFEAPAKLPFRVIANSELGITKVEYWVNDDLIATVTNAPYSYDWNNVEEGTYTIVAKAFDSEGSTDSDPVSVTVYPPSEKYKLNGKELSDFGIIPGRAPNSNISVSGHLDFPKRLGKSFHVWDDEEGVEPYVSYDEIKFEGRDIRFHGYVEGDDKNDVMRKLYAFYDFLNTLNGEVLFSCKWGSWLVIVQSEVEATQIKTGMVSIVVTFRQTDTGIQPVQSGGTADRGIDGISFGDLGFTYMNLKNQWYRPTTKDHHAIGYYTEPFQVTKAGAREMVLSGLLETETYQEMVDIVSSLYSLFAKEGVRTLQINNEPFREFFVKDGFQVTNIIIKHQKCMALLSINMMELNKPIFDPDFFTDTDGNYILSNTNQKIIIRK